METQTSCFWHSHDSPHFRTWRQLSHFPKKITSRKRHLWKQGTSDEKKKKEREKCLSTRSCFILTHLDTRVLHSRCFITASQVNRVEEPEQYKSQGFLQLSIQLLHLLLERSSALHPAKLIYLSASPSLELSRDFSDKRQHIKLHTEEVSSAQETLYTSQAS